jgi:hypothetical protein
MNYMDQFTSEFIQALDNFKKKNDEAYIIDMKRSLASMQAVVDELNEDLQSQTR